MNKGCILSTSLSELLFNNSNYHNDNFNTEASFYSKSQNINPGYSQKIKD